MKNFNPQLNDTMILALADARDLGVDFSHAIEMCQIPSEQKGEAEVYWTTLNKQAEVIHQIFPEDSIVDSILEKMNAPVSETFLKESTPSPYMKFVMAFAAPLSILVMIVGLAYRQDDSAKPVALNNLDENVSISSIIKDSPSETSSDSGEAMNSKVAADSSASAAPKIMAARMVAAPAPVVDKEAIEKSDPKQLFAMLTNTGSYEAEPDTLIDEEYDAKLLELDSKVIDSNNSNNTYGAQ